jgi:hypothetical protein
VCLGGQSRGGGRRGAGERVREVCREDGDWRLECPKLPWVNVPLLRLFPFFYIVHNKIL